MAESTNPNGIQILVPSQYTDVYKISTYGGAPAMVTKQNSVQLIWLDKEFDRPEFLPTDISNPIKTNEIGTSDFKINIHLGYPGGKKVGNWSEDGSQVFATADELKDFFSNCEKHRELYDNSFSYTLVTKDDWDTAVKNVEANKGAKNTIPEKQIAAVEKEKTEKKLTNFELVQKNLYSPATFTDAQYIIVKFNDGKNQATFWSNDRVFFSGPLGIITKGTYSNGGKTIVLDSTLPTSGKKIEGPSVWTNISNAIK